MTNKREVIVVERGEGCECVPMRHRETGRWVMVLYAFAGERAGQATFAERLCPHGSVVRALTAADVPLDMAAVRLAMVDRDAEQTRPPRVGEVYRDNYPYEIPRFVRVVARVEPERPKQPMRWEIEVIGTGRRTKVKEASFRQRPAGTGYSLISMAEEASLVREAQEK